MIHRFAGGESIICQRRIQDCLLWTQELCMCESLDSYDMPTSRLEKEMSDIPVNARGSSDRSWVAVLMLIVLFLVPAALTLDGAYTVNRRNQPTDEELKANFLTHEAKFDELVDMLNSDRRSLPLRGGESIDLAGLSAVVASAARMDMYKGLLRQISVTDLRYFPSSGKVILPKMLKQSSESSRLRPGHSPLLLLLVLNRYEAHAEPRHCLAGGCASATSFLS